MLKAFKRDPLRFHLWGYLLAASLLLALQVALLATRGTTHRYGIAYTCLVGLIAVSAALALRRGLYKPHSSYLLFNVSRNAAIVGMMVLHWCMGWPCWPAIMGIIVSDLSMVAAITPPQKVSQFTGVVASTILSSIGALILIF
jgi:hypothetical protein